jgi:hypothetical protein
VHQIYSDLLPIYAKNCVEATVDDGTRVEDRISGSREGKVKVRVRICGV